MTNRGRKMPDQNDLSGRRKTRNVYGNVFERNFECSGSGATKEVDEHSIKGGASRRTNERRNEREGKKDAAEAIKGRTKSKGFG